MQMVDVSIPLRGFLFATFVMSSMLTTSKKSSFNPLTGLFVCNALEQEEEDALVELAVSIPLRGFLFATEPNVARLDGNILVVSIPLRGFLFATRGPPPAPGRASPPRFNPLTGLFVCNYSSAPKCALILLRFQSPYGAFCLQQHTPLNAVLYRGAGGGIYEKLELSTAPLWITGVKSAFFAMRAYFPALLDFLWRGFALFIAKPGFQSALSKCSTTAL